MVEHFYLIDYVLWFLILFFKGLCLWNCLCVCLHIHISLVFFFLFSVCLLLFCLFFYYYLFFFYLLISFLKKKRRYRVRWEERRGTIWSEYIVRKCFNLKTKEKTHIVKLHPNICDCSLILIWPSTLAREASPCNGEQLMQRLITLTNFQWVIFCLGKDEISEAFWCVFFSWLVRLNNFLFHPYRIFDSFVGWFDWLLVQMICFSSFYNLLNFIKYILAKIFLILEASCLFVV